MYKKRVLWITLLMAALALVVAGCGKSEPAASDESVFQTAPISTPVSIIDQVRKSQHYKMFPTLIAEKENNPNFDYADTCLKCHSETAILYDKNAKMNDFFAGGKYAGQRQGITCIVCHNFEGEKMVTLKYKGWDSCTVCHTAGSISVGKEVHHSQKEMVEGVGIGDVAGKPSYKWANMKDNFSCIDCHSTNSLKHDFMVPGVKATYDSLGTTRTGTQLDYGQFSQLFKQDKCVGCHYDPSKTVDKIRQHQTEITKMLETLKPTFENWEKKLSSASQDDPRVKQLNTALSYYTYVTSDASKGAHNYELAKSLLVKADAEISKLK